MTNRFTSAMSAEGPDAQFETMIAGICPSLPNPRETKREPQTFVDVLAAEDVGRFQDRNVTEAFSVLVA